MRFHHHLKCSECGEIWVMRSDVVSWLVNFKRCTQVEADIELGYQIHMTNHKLEKIEAYVKEHGL